jgi:hypothetical protein
MAFSTFNRTALSDIATICSTQGTSEREIFACRGKATSRHGVEASPFFTLSNSRILRRLASCLCRFSTVRISDECRRTHIPLLFPCLILRALVTLPYRVDFLSSLVRYSVPVRSRSCNNFIETINYMIRMYRIEQ